MIKKLKRIICKIIGHSWFVSQNTLFEYRACRLCDKCELVAENTSYKNKGNKDKIILHEWYYVEEK